MSYSCGTIKCKNKLHIMKASSKETSKMLRRYHAKLTIPQFRQAIEVIFDIQHDRQDYKHLEVIKSGQLNKTVPRKDGTTPSRLHTTLIALQVSSHLATLEKVHKMMICRHKHGMTDYKEISSNCTYKIRSTSRGHFLSHWVFFP